MRRTLTAAAAAALTLGLVAGPAAAKPDRAGPPDNGMTIVETAVAVSGTPFEFDDNGGDFDILVAAVIATGADGILNGEMDYTVFAPTDQAFVDLASAIAGTPLTEEESYDALVATLDVPGVTAVLLYHVAPDWTPRSEIAKPSSLTMADGNSIRTKGASVDADFSSADLVPPKKGIRTIDGGIYVIDTVLLPIDPTPLLP